MRAAEGCSAVSAFGLGEDAQSFIDGSGGGVGASRVLRRDGFVMLAAHYEQRLGQVRQRFGQRPLRDPVERL